MFLKKWNLDAAGESNQIIGRRDRVVRVTEVRVVKIKITTGFTVKAGMLAFTLEPGRAADMLGWFHPRN